MYKLYIYPLIWKYLYITVEGWNYRYLEHVEVQFELLWPEIQIFFFSYQLAHNTATIRGFWNIFDWRDRYRCYYDVGTSIDLTFHRQLVMWHCFCFVTDGTNSDDVMNWNISTLWCWLVANAVEWNIEIYERVSNSSDSDIFFWHSNMNYSISN